MRFFWFVLFILIMAIAYVISFFKNTFLFFYNITHKRKRAYWNPATWMTDERYDVTEKFFHD